MSSKNHNVSRHRGMRKLKLFCMNFWGVTPKNKKCVAWSVEPITKHEVMTRSQIGELNWFGCLEASCQEKNKWCSKLKAFSQENELKCVLILKPCVKRIINTVLDSRPYTKGKENAVTNSRSCAKRRIICLFGKVPRMRLEILRRRFHRGVMIKILN